MLSFGEWASLLERAALRAKNEVEFPTEVVMKAAEEVAKEAIGTYTFGWPQLAQSTQEERSNLGYPPNEPLLREGDLRDSIEHKVEPTFGGAEGVLGSHSMVALYQELGTSRGIPPRPFLSEALLRSEPIIEVTFGRFTMSVLTFGEVKF